MPFTIRKMMQLPALRGAKLLAGAGGADNLVCGVVVPENADLSGGAARGSVILTGTFFLRLLSLDGAEIVERCRKSGAAGLCVKCAGGDGARPEDALLRAAEQQNFPVVLLGKETSLSQVLNAITYEILRRDGYDRRLSYEENFFQELLTSVQDRDTFFKRGEMLGLGRDEKLCALLLQPDDGSCAEEVRTFCRDRWEHRCYALTKNTRVLLALRLTTSEMNRDAVVEIARALLAQLRQELPDVRFRMGIGRCHKDVTNFNKSFFEACSALSFSMLAHSGEPISHFNDLGVYRILFDYKNREELFQLYRDTVGAILEYDRENRTSYMETIRVYFDQNYSINNTAKKLFVHYNTILYRLSKIKSLFGIDLNNEEERVNLYVSLRVADTQNLWKTF